LEGERFSRRLKGGKRKTSDRERGRGRICGKKREERKGGEKSSPGTGVKRVSLASGDWGEGRKLRIGDIIHFMVGPASELTKRRS